MKLRPPPKEFLKKIKTDFGKVLSDLHLTPSTPENLNPVGPRVWEEM